MSEALHILIVDDEINIRKTLSLCLNTFGYQVQAVAGADEAVALTKRYTFDIAFVDIRLGAVNGIQLIPALLSQLPNLVIIMITAYASIESAVEAIHKGAYDYLPKPFTPVQIRHLIQKIGERRGLQRRIYELEEILSKTLPETFLITTSPVMQRALDIIQRAATSNVAVLLRGESGTGKGVLARLLHEHSPRANRPFVTINCPILTDDLLVSELFGHTKGAFTGAVRDQAGKIEVADNGTLFLDEVGEISPTLQSKLLRFVQDKQFERVGESTVRKADVRIVTATNRNLEADIEVGRFRLDLFYRLNVVEITVPALRERSEDIEPLARHFLQFHAHDLGVPVPELSPDAIAVLSAYSWPGNIRELRNEMERALVLNRSSTLFPESFSHRVRGAHSPIPKLGSNFTLEDITREHILRVLERSPTQEEAAHILGIDPSTLWRKLKKYNYKP